MFKNNRFTIQPFREESKELFIDYGFSQTQFGNIVLGIIPKIDHTSICICYLHWADKLKEPNHHVQQLQKCWPKAILREDQQLAEQVTKQIFSEKVIGVERPFEVVVNGTEFQQAVWKGLLEIPSGETCTYSDVAEMIGKPKAVRAVANAVANNEISMLIPCHRVVSKGGNKLKYGGGAERKRQLLEYEGAEI